ncbi:hypothetical protein [Flexistipes sp.]|uniref:hypothetical protein n=1 Tax=Flexistipes sp. TaxID=3088135 RepID=UPI002E1F1B51|nr:hypothetical protein [Flexistipes sp.]
MMIKTNEKGMALIITLVLSFVALGFIAAILYLLNTSTSGSGATKRYSMALETAKGVSDYVVEKILSDDLTCSGSSCDSGESIDIDIAPPNHNISAIMLSDPKKVTVDEVDYTIYSVRVEAENDKTNDKAIIEFVYRTY